jgi:hypothetical protein
MKDLADDSQMAPDDASSSGKSESADSNDKNHGQEWLG